MIQMWLCLSGNLESHSLCAGVIDPEVLTYIYIYICAAQSVIPAEHESGPSGFGASPSYAHTHTPPHTHPWLPTFILVQCSHSHGLDSQHFFSLHSLPPSLMVSGGSGADTRPNADINVSVSVVSI